MKKIDIIIAIIVILLIWIVQSFAVRAPDYRLYDWSGGLAVNPNPLLLTRAMSQGGKVYSKRLDNFFIRDGKLIPRGGTRAVFDSLERTVSVTGARFWTGVVTAFFESQVAEEEFSAITIRFDSISAKSGGFWDGFTLYNTDSSISAKVRLSGYNPDPGDTLVGFFNIDNRLFKVDSGIVISHDVSIQSEADDTGSTSWVFGYSDKNRRQRLLTVSPSFGSENRWSALYASDVNSYQPRHKLWDYIYKNETPQAVQLGDRVFIALDRQDPIVFDGNRARLLIPAGSGELKVAPITQPGPMIGTYKWGLVQAKGTLADSEIVNYRIGHITTKVTLDGEQAVIRGFPSVARDSVRNVAHASDSDIGDTSYYYLVRTKGRPLGFVSPTDTFYVLKFLRLHINELDIFKYVDSLSDDSLPNADHVIVSDLDLTGNDSLSATIPPDTVLIDAITKRQTSAGDGVHAFSNFRFTAPGALSYLGNTMSDDGWIGADSTSSPNDSDWNVTEYMIVTIDTSLKSVSDTSPNLIIQHSFPVMKVDANDSSIGSITLGIPRVFSPEEHTIRVIYRRQGYIARSERKVRIHEGSGEIVIIGSGVVQNFVGFFRIPPTERLIHSPYYPVGILTTDSQTVFVDDMTWDDLFFRGISDTNDFVDLAWLPQKPIDYMKGFFTLGNQLFGWDNHLIYRAVQNEPGNFEILSFLSVNTHDGDFLTACYGYGQNVVALKENSRTEIFNPKSEFPTLGEVESGRGCIASRTFVQLGPRVYYLSNSGVVEESPRQFKTFGSESKIISRMINDLLIGRRKPAQIANARMHANFDNLFLSYPGTETTFVYSFVDEAWSIFRNFEFNAMTLYDTTGTEGRIPGSFIVLCRDGFERAFLFNDTNTFDWVKTSGAGGELIHYVFRTHALKHDGNMWRVSELGLRYEALSTFGSDSIVMKIFDEIGGNQLDTILFPWQAASSPVEYLRRMCNVHMGYDLSIGGSTHATFRNDTFAILGIDVWMESVGEPERE